MSLEGYIVTLISETSIGLRFFGDDLTPAELTRAFGNVPTSCTVKGEIIVCMATGKCRVAKTGSWVFDVVRREPGDLNHQIQELFGALTADLTVWRGLTAKFKSDLFVGLFMRESNEGIDLDVRCIELLAERSVPLTFDVYGPLSEAE